MKYFNLDKIRFFKLKDNYPIINFRHHGINALVRNIFQLFVKKRNASALLFLYYLGFFTCACAAASLATGTLNGEQDT